MRIVVVHNAVPPGAPPEESDVLDQVQAVSGSLRQLGHRVAVLPCTLDLQLVGERLEELRPDVVFNLVESLGGSDALMHLVPAVLDSRGIPYTGSPTRSIFLTNDKLLAKGFLRDNGLPTPAWASLRRHQGQPPAGENGQPLTGSFVIKAVSEHSSFGLEEVVSSAGPARSVGDLLRLQEARWDRPCFAEEYVEGREFNVSLLAGPGGVDAPPEVLPPAEIDFSGLPPGRPRIVGYRAKWDKTSAEYRNTPRTFDFLSADGLLLEQLHRLALGCWQVFQLQGYARVDFRVDEQRRPWILEVNTNPCLSPDAGFAAALDRAQVEYKNAIERIVQGTPAPAQRGDENRSRRGLT